jgi:hypothetical protein
MGGGVSTSSSKSTVESPSSSLKTPNSSHKLLKLQSFTPREIAIQRKIMIDSVEAFVMNVYASCPRIEGMWLILSSKLGQKAFENFCKSEFSDDLLILFMEISKILSLKSIRIEQLNERIEGIKVLLQQPVIDQAVPILLKNEFFFGDEISVVSGGDVDEESLQFQAR